LYFVNDPAARRSFAPDPRPISIARVERMAGLLAIQCLVRGTDPGDFEILVAALLSRFGVENRAELARRAAGFLRPVIGEMNPEPGSEGPGRRALGPVAYALGTFDGDDRKPAFETICKEHSGVHTL
jgi:hypothetical protein